ncbi:hypothetical protein Ancab_028460 [Ancistrocladus abbreviatus]
MPPPERAGSSATRLQREDCHRTKHDSAFTKWQVLIGATDWSDYGMGKEGAERYRVQNLPARSGPGLYEIGVAVWPTVSGRQVGKLAPDRIVVVYLGQANDVRSRLQRYGRGGAHLESKGNDESFVPRVQTEPGEAGSLFKDIFSKGYAIVYRWAPMNSKIDATRTEAKLLDKFDYAWNKVGNGARRPNDVLRKIEDISSRTIQVPRVVKMLKHLSHRQVGIPIKASQPLEDKSSDELYEGSYNLLPQVLRLVRSRPRLVSDTIGSLEDDFLTYTCRVTLSDGSVCVNPPVEGRKRCAKHKGRRINGSEPTMIIPQTGSLILGSGNPSLEESDKLQNRGFSSVKEKLPSNGSTYSFNEEFVPICAVILDDGSPCKQQPVPGRKRCEEHKGWRITQPIVKLLTEDASDNHNLQPQFMSERSLPHPCHEFYCGVILGNGSYCRRQPVEGRKRCEEHKGMRVDTLVSKTSMNISCGFNLGAECSYSFPSRVSYASSAYECAVTCGVPLSNGSYCSRMPAQGRKRCWQHKGMRA